MGRGIAHRHQRGRVRRHGQTTPLHCGRRDGCGYYYLHHHHIHHDHDHDHHYHYHYHNNNNCHRHCHHHHEHRQWHQPEHGLILLADSEHGLAARGYKCGRLGSRVKRPNRHSVCQRVGMIHNVAGRGHNGIFSRREAQIDVSTKRGGARGRGRRPGRRHLLTPHTRSQRVGDSICARAGHGESRGGQVNRLQDDRCAWP